MTNLVKIFNKPGQPTIIEGEMYNKSLINIAYQYGETSICTYKINNRGFHNERML